jgi:hypothetical protein
MREHDWQPIETAPLGEWVLVWSAVDEHVTFGITNDGSKWWEANRDDQLFPTHWMSLPAPPEPR